MPVLWNREPVRAQRVPYLRATTQSGTGKDKEEKQEVLERLAELDEQGVLEKLERWRR